MARFAAIGLDHRHVYDMTEGLLKAGAECAGYNAGYHGSRASWRGSASGFPHVPEVARERLLDDRSIDFIVLSAVPCDRAAVAIDAMRRGKDVVSDKPGVTSLEQLEAVRRRGPRYRAVMVDLRWPSDVSGDPGGVRVVRRVSLGDWCRLSAWHLTGSIARYARPGSSTGRRMAGSSTISACTRLISSWRLAEVAEAEIESSTIGVFGTEPKGFEDFAEITLRTPSVRGYCRVDWFTPDGLPTWGDGRLFLIGTEGTLELRKNLDLEGRPGSNHMFVAGKDRTRYLDCSRYP